MTGRRSQSLAQLERDAALVRVNRVRRWALAGAAALTAAIAAFVSAIAPGRSLGAKRGAAFVPSSTAATQASSKPKMPPLASAADLGLQGPSGSPQPAPSDPSQTAQSQQQAAPAPAPAPAPVVSGGS